MAVTYSTINELSKTDVITEFLATRVIGPVLPSVQVKRVRAKEGRRFEAPRVLWNVYEATFELPGGIESTALFWTKAFFDGGEAEKYRERVSRLLSSQEGNPLDPNGYLRHFDDLNLFLFFFPVDPVFPALRMFFDPDQAMPILARHFAHLSPAAAVRHLRTVRVKYLPEISLIARFEADVGEDRPLSLYGKFQHSHRGAFTYEVMRALWDLPARAAGELVVSEPLAYYPQYQLLLQSEVPGEEIPRSRHSDVFKAQCEAAGRTLAHIHNSKITVGHPHTVDVEIERLEERLDQFKMSGPRLFLNLRALLTQIRAKAERVPVEAPVPSHGDYKYNQFIYDGTKFGLIDVEYFVQAEPSFDLGKYCGHLAPSIPKDWTDTVVADEGRRAFLDAYRALRPQYRGARFSIYESLSLATRALVVIWSRPTNWQYTAETLIALAFERLKTRWGE
jgi:aminoglycoside phosphotransferase (APT) family kinase protein